VDFHLDNFQVSEYQLIQQGAGEIVLILPARYAAQAAEIAAALSRGLAAQFEPAAELTIVPQATGKWHLTPRGKRNAIVRN
jgi:propanediol dehydratase small subunit